MGIDACKIIELPKIADRRGNLTAIEGGRHIPFDIKRVYYLCSRGEIWRAIHG